MCGSCESGCSEPMLSNKINEYASDAKLVAKFKILSTSKMKLQSGPLDSLRNRQRCKKIKKTNQQSKHLNSIKRKNSSELVTDTSLPSKSRTCTKMKSTLQQVPSATKIIDSFHFSQLLYARLSDLTYRLGVSISTAGQTFEMLKRYLSRAQIPYVDLNLAMLSCFLIICKFYQSWGKVLVQDLVRYSGRMFSREILIQMQAHILQTLDFQIQQIGPKEGVRSARVLQE